MARMARSLQLPMLMALMLTLTACDSGRDVRAKKDRGDSRYNAAMAAYSAGQIDKAIEGLGAAIAADPLNASARFVLAGLLQDSKKDYLEAAFHYREFLLLEPKGEKSAIARERLDRAMKAYTASMTEKRGKSDGSSEDFKAMIARIDELEKQLAESEQRCERVSADNERLSRLIDGISEEEEDPRRVIEVGNLLDDDESDQIDVTADAEAMIADAEAEENDAGEMSKMLPEQAPDAKEKKAAAAAAKKDAQKAAEKEAAARPKEYTVQEGDSLYKIALRFYGRTSAWKDIREANKATISTDGRIKAGQRIALP